MFGQRQATRIWRLATYCAAALLVACATEPPEPVSIGNAASLTAGESIPLRPTAGAGLETVVIGPGERIRIRESQTARTRFICSTGRPMECQRIGLRSYCQCSGAGESF